MFKIIHYLLMLICFIDIIFGFYLASDDNQRIYPILKKQRSAEYDNEYVWFTRDVANEQLRPKPLFRPRFSNKQRQFYNDFNFDTER